MYDPKICHSALLFFRGHELIIYSPTPLHRKGYLMRELTAEEKKAYNHIVLGSKQMRLDDFINGENDTRDTLPPFPDETDKRTIFTQMTLFD